MAAVPFLPPAPGSPVADRAWDRPRLPLGWPTVRTAGWRSQVVALLPFVVALGVLVSDRSVLASAVGRITSLGPTRLALVLLVLLAHKAATATVHHGATEGVGWGRAALASEAYVGASNAMVGGSGLGTGVRVAMLRSWGVDAMDAAAAVTLTAGVPPLVMWGIAVVHTTPGVLTGGADALSTAIAIAGLLAIVLPLAVGRRLLRDAHALVRPAMLAHRTRARLLDVVRARRPHGRLHATMVRSALAHADVIGGAERLHARIAGTVRRRLVRVAAASVVAQLSSALLLVVCVEVLAPAGTHLAVLPLLRAYALLRVAAAFVPLPGGIGVLDLGLLGVLGRTGVDRSTAIAALGLFRSLTFALPLVSGPLATIWRQATHRRARRADDVPVASA